MKRAVITEYDVELVEKSKVFLEAAEGNPGSRSLLEQFGYSKEEHDRGLRLVKDAGRAFEWENAGTAWNYLSRTPEKRVKEAREWYADTRRRYMRSCLRRAEAAAGLSRGTPEASWPVWKKLTVGTARGLLEAARVVSPRALLEHRAEMKSDVARAKGQKPEGAPPPKDTALVELGGWYERWRLLAQRVFRERADLMAPYGLTPGKAPPRLRGKEAAKYGEKAAPRLPIFKAEKNNGRTTPA
jgi:hypothetical protein